MWRVVENALSVRSLVAKPRPPPVENECGQMCTEHLDHAPTSPLVHPEFSTEIRREFTRFRVKNARRDTLCHVTRRHQHRDAPSVEKARAIHIDVWTDC